MNIFEKYPQYRLEGAIGNTGISVRSFGVTTLCLDDGSTKVLFDCMITRPSMLRAVVGKLDSDQALVNRLIQENELQGLNAIFASHSHYDHILDLPNFARGTGADVYGSVSTLNIARGNGVPEEKLHRFCGGETFSVGRFSIKVINSIHSKPAFYNNDLGVEIREPLKLPAPKGSFTEGGSFDFLIQHDQTRMLIRPSCNYIKGQLDGIHADILFLGTGQLSKLSPAEKEQFYAETVCKVQPKLVIPVHWDNFFAPLEQAENMMPKLFDDTVGGMDYLLPKLKSDGIRFGILPVLKMVHL